MKKAILLFGIFILLSDIALCESIRATTEDGKTVILHPNRTWEYQKVPTEEQIKSETLSYTKPSLSQELFKGKRGNYGIWIDENKWSKIITDNPKSDLQFIHVDGDVYAITFSERIAIPLEAMKKVVLYNAKQGGAKDEKITFEDRRIVNGQEVVALKLDATMVSVPFIFFYYIYSSKEGTIQIAVYTGKSLFDEYKNDITNFLNGLEVFTD